MTEEDKYALKEFLRGASVFVGASVVFIIIMIVLAYFASGDKSLEPSPPGEKFEVVDTYKGCSVVRYSPTNAARYSYFLDCTDELLMGMPYGTTSIKAREEKYNK